MKSYLIYQKPKRLGQDDPLWIICHKISILCPVFHYTGNARAAENVDKAAIMNTWSGKASEI